MSDSNLSLTNHLQNYSKLCTKQIQVKLDVQQSVVEEQNYREGYKQFLLENKEFKLLKDLHTQGRKVYMHSMSLEMRLEILREKKRLEEKLNNMTEKNINDLFVHRKDRREDLQTQLEQIKKSKEDTLYEIHTYGAFDIIIDGKRYIQTINKNKGSITKKNFITAFVGNKSHHKWKSIEEFEKDWKKYFAQDKYNLTCSIITESRKRERDTNISGDDSNPTKK